MFVTLASTPLNNAYVGSYFVRKDSRGSFSRFFSAEELKEILGQRNVVQINHSYTAKKGSIRGMHFQRQPHAEAKIVRCIRGRVWDVAVDLRPSSPSFLKWHGVELSAEAANFYLIPEGCAHGFQTLTDDCELLYLHTASYAPQSEGGVSFDDPKLGIKWPLPAIELSERDLNWDKIDSSFLGIDV